MSVIIIIILILIIIIINIIAITIIMEICKARTPPLKALTKRNTTNIMYSEMDNVISNWLQ